MESAVNIAAGVIGGVIVLYFTPHLNRLFSRWRDRQRINREPYNFWELFLIVAFWLFYTCLYSVIGIVVVFELLDFLVPATKLIEDRYAFIVIVLIATISGFGTFFVIRNID